MLAFLRRLWLCRLVAADLAQALNLPGRDVEPGAVRDELVRNQVDLDETIARIFRGGISERHFGADADPEQFAFQMHGILLAFHQHSRLLGDPLAAQRARRALDALLDASRP